VSEDATIPRRNVLAVGAAGVVVGGAALAGCGSSDSGGGGTATTTAPNDTGAATSAATTPAPATSAPATTPAGTTDPANALAKVADIPSGGSLKVNGSDGKPVILFRSGNTVTAHSAICTHMGCTVNTNGAELDCPCHGSKYNAQTGAVINGPAPKPLPEVKVTVSGGSVVAG
jgi:cytochrome b6-f complex iron-sulfur subunit